VTDEPLVDAHVHFFDHDVDGLRWRYLEPDFDHPRLRGMHRLDAQRFTAPELRAEAEGSGLAQVVHIQSADAGDVPERETAWLSSMATADPLGWPGAIVGWCRLRASDAGDVMCRHARHPAATGVRDMALTEGFEPDEVATALVTAAELGFSVELLVPPPWYRAVGELADRFPSVTLVLGHAGLPLERNDAYRSVWLDGLQRLATRPNVVVKVSALASGSDPQWTVDSLRPWVLGCIEAFGPDRAMLATNWPIDRLFGSYAGLVDAYRSIIAELGPDERAALLAGTAQRVYGVRTKLRAS
jgi:predicted TIM-barrel fold metal-dependent hydrolase